MEGNGREGKGREGVNIGSWLGTQKERDHMEDVDVDR